MLISICIPTRERAIYLAACLRTCVAIDDAEIEIVVSDNASTDDTAAVVAGFADPRIRYLKSETRLSQRQNFEAVVVAARGDYVMVIGDDDAVLAGQWARLRAILESEQPDVLSWPSIFYQWPSPAKAGGGGRLRLKRQTVNGNCAFHASDAMITAIGALTYDRHRFLPAIYHGIAARRVIEALRARTGDLFMSAQVDVYFAVAALAVTERFATIHHPFTIMAMGPKSGGASVQLQARPGGDNDSARLLAVEARADPIAEVLEMPFPCLGFHLLAGIEQARRVLLADRLVLDYPKYVGLIGGQLEKLSAPLRAQGLALLEKLAAGLGDPPDLLQAIDTLRHRLAQRPPPMPPGAWRARMPRLAAWLRRVEGLSYLQPGRFGIDLKPRGLAAVDGAARAADWLIGTEAAPRLSPAAARARWRASRWRAARLVLHLEPAFNPWPRASGMPAGIDKAPGRG